MPVASDQAERGRLLHLTPTERLTSPLSVLLIFYLYAELADLGIISWFIICLSGFISMLILIGFFRLIVGPWSKLFATKPIRAKDQRLYKSLLA